MSANSSRHLSATVCNLFAVIAAPTSVAAQTWVDDSFEDFADGRLDAAGQNIYVARDGTVRTIHRFDLNDDGYLDLLFNSTHDDRSFVPATLCAASSGRRIRQSSLAVEGSLQAAVHDLNRDSHLDLVFCPNYGGIQTARRLLTIIWGGDDGWPSHRSNALLPVHDAKAVAVADLNRDDWPDIVVLNGQRWLPSQPAGPIVRVFWGGSQGFLLSRRLDIGVPNAIDLAAADFDADSAIDLAVLTTDKRIRIFWATKRNVSTVAPSATNPEPHKLQTADLSLPVDGPQCLAAADCNADKHTDLIVGTSKKTLLIIAGKPGRSFAEPQTVSAFAASHVAVGDLDADKHPDLILTDFAIARAAGGEAVAAERESPDPIRILWGGRDNFAASRSSGLAVKNASATAVGDLDADGRADLAVAVYQGHKQFAGDSLIFFGTGTRKLSAAPKPVRTEGAAHVVVAPPNANHPARAVFCNSKSGMLHERVPLLCYWGGPDGFDPKRLWKIPFAGGYEATAADLNADGFVDLVAMNSGHGGPADTTGELGANIFWGTAAGFDLKNRRTVLRHYGLWASNVADLNRDGWLDLVLGVFGSIEKDKPEQLIIYYGSADGFDPSRPTMIPSPGRSGGCAIADFNRDDWLDIAVTSYEADCARIFWGGADGFDEKRQIGLDVPRPIGLETADLNADGRLDLIVGSYQDPIAGHHDTGVTIFWGSSAGFRHANAQTLPGRTPVGMTVADFDADGFLDLFCPHYHADLTRESMPCYLYWNSPTGFAPRRRTVFVCDSADDALAGDFNRDGLLDLAVVCHSVDGNHNTVSRVFYNDSNRFEKPAVTTLPTHGAHWMWLQDMGHIYHRNWQQTYDSSVFTFPRPASAGKLTFKAQTLKGTHLSFAVRAAATKQQLPRKPWQPLTAASPTFSLDPNDRHLQYRATFTSNNGDRYPTLKRVTVTLTPAN